MTATESPVLHADNYERIILFQGNNRTGGCNTSQPTTTETVEPSGISCFLQRQILQRYSRSRRTGKARYLMIWISFFFLLTFTTFYYTAYYNDIVVGAVCCRIDILDGSRRLYIMTLGCLAPYRKRGIGAKMLEHVLNYVEKDGDFHSIFL